MSPTLPIERGYVTRHTVEKYQKTEVKKKGNNSHYHLYPVMFTTYPLIKVCYPYYPIFRITL